MRRGSGRGRVRRPRPGGARARGRQGGRPPLLTGDQLKAARRMYEQQDMTVEQIGGVLGVSRTTIYRALRKDAPPQSRRRRAPAEQGV